MQQRSLIPIAFFILQALSCVFTTNIPISNSRPSCKNGSSIKKQMLYPESTICTLLVSDLNDDSLHCSVLPGSDTTRAFRKNETEWPGTYKLLQKTFDVKQLLFTINPNILGRYSGLIIISDRFAAADTVPYDIQRQFFEPFDTHPRYSRYWKPYRTDDTSTIKIDYTDNKLLFMFDTVSNLPTSYTGIVSTFRLAGDFHITVDFRIRDGMDDGFEAGFFVSTSSDTSRWSGDIAGIFLRGSQGRIRLECKSVDLQSFSKEVDLFAGEIGISRDNDIINFFYHDGNPLVSPASLTQLGFSPDDTVFVHVKMTVKDRSQARHSLWNDFYVSRGHIIP